MDAESLVSEHFAESVATKQAAVAAMAARPRTHNIFLPKC